MIRNALEQNLHVSVLERHRPHEQSKKAFKELFSQFYQTLLVKELYPSKSTESSRRQLKQMESLFYAPLQIEAPPSKLYDKFDFVGLPLLEEKRPPSQPYIPHSRSSYRISKTSFGLLLNNCSNSTLESQLSKLNKFPNLAPTWMREIPSNIKLVSLKSLKWIHIWSGGRLSKTIGIKIPSCLKCNNQALHDLRGDYLTSSAMDSGPKTTSMTIPKGILASRLKKANLKRLAKDAGKSKFLSISSTKSKSAFTKSKTKLKPNLNQT
jgi:hypothetical protein